MNSKDTTKNININININIDLNQFFPSKLLTSEIYDKWYAILILINPINSWLIFIEI